MGCCSVRKKDVSIFDDEEENRNEILEDEMFCKDSNYISDNYNPLNKSKKLIPITVKKTSKNKTIINTAFNKQVGMGSPNQVNLQLKKFEEKPIIKDQNCSVSTLNLKSKVGLKTGKEKQKKQISKLTKQYMHSQNEDYCNPNLNTNTNEIFNLADYENLNNLSGSYSAVYNKFNSNANTFSNNKFTSITSYNVSPFPSNPHSSTLNNIFIKSSKVQDEEVLIEKKSSSDSDKKKYYTDTKKSFTLNHILTNTNATNTLRMNKDGQYVSICSLQMQDNISNLSLNSEGEKPEEKLNLKTKYGCLQSYVFMFFEIENIILWGLEYLESIYSCLNLLLIIEINDDPTTQEKIPLETNSEEKLKFIPLLKKSHNIQEKFKQNLSNVSNTLLMNLSSKVELNNKLIPTSKNSNKNMPVLVNEGFNYSKNTQYNFLRGFDSNIFKRKVKFNYKTCESNNIQSNSGGSYQIPNNNANLLFNLLNHSALKEKEISKIKKIAKINIKLCNVVDKVNTNYTSSELVVISDEDIFFLLNLEENNIKTKFQRNLNLVNFDKKIANLLFSIALSVENKNSNYKLNNQETIMIVSKFIKNNPKTSSVIEKEDKINKFIYYNIKNNYYSSKESKVEVNNQRKDERFFSVQDIDIANQSGDSKYTNIAIKGLVEMIPTCKFKFDIVNLLSFIGKKINSKEFYENNNELLRNYKLSLVLLFKVHFDSIKNDYCYFEFLMEVLIKVFFLKRRGKKKSVKSIVTDSSISGSNIDKISKVDSINLINSKFDEKENFNLNDNFSQNSNRSLESFKNLKMNEKIIVSGSNFKKNYEEKMIPREIIEDLFIGDKFNDMQKEIDENKNFYNNSNLSINSRDISYDSYSDVNKSSMTSVKYIESDTDENLLDIMFSKICEIIDIKLINELSFSPNPEANLNLSKSSLLSLNKYTDMTTLIEVILNFFNKLINNTNINLIKIKMFLYKMKFLFDTLFKCKDNERIVASCTGIIFYLIKFSLEPNESNFEKEEIYNLRTNEYLTSINISTYRYIMSKYYYNSIIQINCISLLVIVIKNSPDVDISDVINLKILKLTFFNFYKHFQILHELILTLIKSLYIKENNFKNKLKGDEIAIIVEIISNNFALCKSKLIFINKEKTQELPYYFTKIFKSLSVCLKFMIKNTNFEGFKELIEKEMILKGISDFINNSLIDTKIIANINSYFTEEKFYYKVYNKTIFIQFLLDLMEFLISNSVEAVSFFIIKILAKYTAEKFRNIIVHIEDNEENFSPKVMYDYLSKKKVTNKKSYEEVDKRLDIYLDLYDKYKNSLPQVILMLNQKIKKKKKV